MADEILDLNTEPVSVPVAQTPIGIKMIFVVFGALACLAALGGLLFAYVRTAAHGGDPVLDPSFDPVYIGALVLLSISALVFGVGLLYRKKWVITALVILLISILLKLVVVVSSLGIFFMAILPTLFVLVPLLILIGLKKHMTGSYFSVLPVLLFFLALIADFLLVGFPGLF